MFNSLFGTITAKLPQQLFLQSGGDAGGIEWDLCVPDSSLEALPAVGEQTRVYTWLCHKEDALKLFGFASAAERSVFIDLMKVEGIGPKGAAKILSNIPAPQLAAVLDEGDLARLEQVPGIGKKSAQKMLLALKGKLTLSQEAAGAAKKAATPWQDVIAALCGMGYDKREVEPVVAELAEGLAQGLGKKESEDLIFRRAIVELAN